MWCLTDPAVHPRRARRRASALILAHVLALTTAAAGGCATASPDPVAASAQASALTEVGVVDVFNGTGASAPAKPCDDAAHREFDFWVGTWEVSRPDGAAAGRNKIERVLDGCALLESWESASGPYRGHSLNTFDARRGVWHQTWVDTGGLLLRIEGGLDAEGRMVLRGELPGPEGTLLHEISWTPQGVDRVRQRWRVSSDGGASWRDLFVGDYRRVAAR